MAGLRQHVEKLTRQAQVTLQGLPAVGVDAQGDGRAAVARCRQFAPQHGGGIGFPGDVGLEIEARREPEIGVARPREAVAATVLAALVGIDGLAEGDVGRRIAADDRARRVHHQDGRSGHRRVAGGVPAVVEGRALPVGKTGVRIEPAAAALKGDRPFHVV